MAESIQHKLSRVRKPRVQITYDVEIGDAIEKKELPFVVGVMADLSGNPIDLLPVLKERKFIEIDRDNFLDIMAIINPRLTIRVPNKLSTESKEISFEILFKIIDDFAPQNIAKNVPILAELFDRRNVLKDLITKMDGNDKMETMLTSIMKSKEMQEQLAKEIEEYK